MTLPRLWPLLVAAAAAGCIVPEKFVDVDAGSGGGDDIDAEIPVVPYSDVDLLFVIDNSGSMAEEQATLGRAIPSFLNALASNGELPGLHIGMVTSELSIGNHSLFGCEDPSDDGNLIIPAGCPVDGAFLSDERTATGERVRNYTGGLGDATACMAEVGTDGCGFEQHLEAMRVVLNGERPGNAGFLRPDALLVVVILADEDDCSVSDPMLFATTPDAEASFGPLSSHRCTTQGVVCGGAAPHAIGSYQDCQPNQLSGYVHPTARYRDFLATLKPDPRQVLLVTITGVAVPFEVIDDNSRPGLAPSCTSSTGAAAPSVRLNWMSDQVERSLTASICDDIATTMATAATFVRTALDGR